MSREEASRLGAGDLLLRHADVRLLGMALHRVGHGLLPNWVSKEAQPTLSRGAGSPPPVKSVAGRREARDAVVPAWERTSPSR